MTSPLPSDLQTAVTTGDPATVLAAALVHFDCQGGTIHVMREGVLKLAASQGIPPHIAQIVETVPVGKGIAGLAAERREAITICNLQTDTSGHARPSAKSTGMEGSVAVPMIVGEEVCGVIGIAKATAHDWTAEEQGLLMALGAAFAEGQKNF